MNVDRIRMTIQRIEANPGRFCMVWPGFCIMGYACPGLMENPQKALGLTASEADELFYPQHKPYDQITTQDALATLGHLCRTGLVDWTPPETH